MLGLLLIPIAFGIAIVVMLTVRRFAPSLHNVADNPLQELLRSPRDAWLFALVVVVAGGVREEIQRAFLLHRFDVWLGGGVVGLVVTSVAFGAGHFDLQGLDAGIATGLLGAFWGIGVPAAAIEPRADREPRRLRSAADRAVPRTSITEGTEGTGSHRATEKQRTIICSLFLCCSV